MLGFSLFFNDFRRSCDDCVSKNMILMQLSCRAVASRFTIDRRWSNLFKSILISCVVFEKKIYFVLEIVSLSIIIVDDLTGEL